MKHQNNIKFILNTIKPFRLLITCLLIVGLIWAIDLSLRPYILKTIIDRMTTIQPNNNSIDKILNPIILYSLMSFVVFIMFRFFNFIWIKLNSPLKRHIGDVLMSRMMQHSSFTIQNHLTGNLANKIKEVMSGIPDLLMIIANNFFSHLLALSLAIFTVWKVNYKFSILLLCWVSIFVFGSMLLSKRAKKLCIRAAEVRSVVIGQIVDILNNITSIHLFCNQKNESKEFKIYLNHYVAADQARDWWFLIIFAFQGLSFLIYQTIVFILLIKDFKYGKVTPGDFTLLININISIINFLWSLSEDLLKFYELIGNINQGLKIALSPIELKDKPHAPDLKFTKGEIVFDAVKFHYPETESLFNNKSVIIKAGEKVGLVGYSGSGKSTFVNLILRLYDVTGGNIFIDKQNIKDVNQHSLRQNIAIIPQDPYLFHRNLIENIRYGKITASDEEVIKAAKSAHADEFISKLSKGYKSMVGERGIKLSGGQRQRIAIARAILKNAPILILDEATSQLDSLTENYIQETLWELMKNKTTIVVAHRLSTLLRMDRILVFEKGKIIQDGHHNKLIKVSGLYQTLWNAQVNGFLPDCKL